METYDAIKKNKEIKDLEEKYLNLCSDKRKAEEELMGIKLKLTQKINNINAELSHIKVDIGRIKREFNINKIDASKVKSLRRKFQSKKESLRKEMLRRHKKKCHYCGSTDNLDIHHLIPLSHGGNNSIENLVFACQSCHEDLH
jgi:hypothetical protein